MKYLKSYEQLNEKAMGDCYPAGGRLIMNFFGDKNHKLVHGMVNGQGSLEGTKYGHCWVESRDTVLDHSNGKKLEIPTKVYYALGGINPKDCIYYTPKESAKWMSEEGHWGPWEMSGDPVVMNEDIPDEHEEIGKREIKIKNKDMKTMKSFEDFNKKSTEDVNEGNKYSVEYSDGMRGSSEFKKQSQAIDFAKDIIKNKKGLQFVSVHKPGMSQTAHKADLLAWWGPGSYWDNKAKKDKSLDGLKIDESTIVEGYKSNIKKKWNSTDIMMDDLREFILDSADAGGVDLVMDIADALKIMTNYALGEHKKLK